MAANDAGGGGHPVLLFKTVNPSDLVDLDPIPDSIYVGGAGNLMVMTIKGDQVMFTCVAGSYHPIRPKRVMSTGTTATNIIALG